MDRLVFWNIQHGYKDYGTRNGPNQTALGSSATSATNKTNSTQNNQALTKGTLSTTVESSGSEPATRNTLSPVQSEERQATAILFSASTSLNEKQSATENLLSTVEDLQSRSEAIESETNPTRRQELVEESEAIRAQAEADFAAAVEENPALAQNETITAVITPGENPDSGQTFTTSVPGASSPEAAGLSGLDFSDTQAASQSLAEIESTLRREVTSFESARTDIASAVRGRGQAIAAESEAESQVDPAARSEQLAREVADSASGITEVSLVDQLDVQSLIIEEEVSREAESRAVESEANRPVAQDDDNTSQTTTIGQDSNEDPATQGNRLVQN